MLHTRPWALRALGHRAYISDNALVPMLQLLSVYINLPALYFCTLAIKTK